MLPKIHLSKDTFLSISLMAAALAVVFGIGFLTLHKKSAQTAATRDYLKEADLHQLAAKSDSLIIEPDQGMMPVLDIISQASSSIDLVMYELNDPEIEQALLDAKNRGVSVRVLLNQGYYGRSSIKNVFAYKFLESHQIPVRWTSPSFALTHEKSLLVDKKLALIMTFNFDHKYYKTSRDFGVLDSDSADVAAISATFDADWSGKAEAPAFGDNLVWSPNSKDALLSLIKSAKKRLEVYNEEMADQDVMLALMDAASRGVSVKLVMAYSSKWKGSFAELSNGGVHIHVYKRKKPLYIHAKAIVADDNYVFIGSQNFSSNSLLKNRELGLLISNPSLAHSLLAVFKNDFDNAQPYSPTP